MIICLFNLRGQTGGMITKQIFDLVEPHFQLAAPCRCLVAIVGADPKAALINSVDHSDQFVAPLLQIEDLPLQKDEKVRYRPGNFLRIIAARVSLCLTKADAKNWRGRIDRQV
ncbi:hypothetical protein UNPF46_12000 [Bradyrhizobium sp. UNPF46]|nr:hypothetical protein UNPF46_12000 [Bradyrhizobium sp. UNPF46]